jgi:subtilisin family serine protease
MGRYVIDVSAGLLRTAASVLTQMAPLVGLAELTQVEARRRYLSAIARFLSTGPDAKKYSAELVLSLMRDALLVEPTEFGELVTVLPGASSIIVRDDSYLRAAVVRGFSRLLGLTLVRSSQRYAAPQPVEEPTADSAAPWHLERVGAGVGFDAAGAVCVGVLDTGLNAGLAGLVEAEIPFQEFDSAGHPVNLGTHDTDPDLHGTSIVSLIASPNVGVAPGVKLAVAAVLTMPNRRGSPEQVRAGIDWLTTTTFVEGRVGVDAISCSVLIPLRLDEQFRSVVQGDLRDRFAFALESGIAVVCAIGNEGAVGAESHQSPGNYPEVISVGATVDGQGNGTLDEVSMISSWGTPIIGTVATSPVPTVSAPGVNVRCLNDGSLDCSGTSFAAPLVAGVVARHLCVTPGALRNPAYVRQLLVDPTRLRPVVPSPNGNLGGAGIPQCP